MNIARIGLKGNVPQFVRIKLQTLDQPLKCIVLINIYRITAESGLPYLQDQILLLESVNPG